MIKQYTENGSHYYDKDGTPRYDASLTIARKEELLISPTTFIKILDKPALTNWKIDQHLLSAHNIMSRFPSTSLEDMKKFASEDFGERNNAADLGTAAHDILDKAIKDAVPPGAFEEFFKAHADPIIEGNLGSIKMAYLWFSKNALAGGSEKVVVNEKFKYAGKIDYDGQVLDATGEKYLGTIIDWKTQKIKHPGFFKNDPTRLKKARVSKYKEWVIQLGAYAAVDGAEQGIIGVIGMDPKYPFFEPVYYNRDMLMRGFKIFRHLQYVWGEMNNWDLSI